MKKLFLLALCTFIGFNAIAQNAETFRKWGDEAWNVIDTRMKNSTYTYLYNDATYASYPAFAWGTGVLFKAMIHGGKIGQAERMYNQFHELYYWEDEKGYGGYTAGANEKRFGRYYDDNAWIGKCLVDLYYAVNNEDNKALYLNRAKMILDFCMSGECPSGGIYFNELSGTDPTWENYEYDQSATCATAPTMCLALKIHRTTGEKESEYLEQGKRLYYYEKETFKWGIGPGFRAYENAVIMEAALLLYEITEEEQYLNDAYTLAHAMIARYIDFETGYLGETGKWGGHDVTDALAYMYQIDGNKYWLDVAARYLTFLYVNLKDSEGFYPEYWDGINENKPRELLDQASAVSAFYRLASAGGGEVRSKAPVAVFEQKNYNELGLKSGWSIGLEAGAYTKDDLMLLGAVNNRFKFTPQLSSLYIQDGYKVTLYKSDNFKGEELVLTDSIADLGSWDNRAYSIKVESIASSVAEKTKTDITIFPTFFDQEFIIGNAPVNTAFSLYNLTGKLVLSGTTTYTNTNINTNGLTKGIYILKTESPGKKQEVFKLHKK